MTVRIAANTLVETTTLYIAWQKDPDLYVIGIYSTFELATIKVTEYSGGRESGVMPISVDVDYAQHGKQ